MLKLVLRLNPQLPLTTFLQPKYFTVRKSPKGGSKAVVFKLPCLHIDTCLMASYLNMIICNNSGAINTIRSDGLKQNKHPGIPVSYHPLM